MVRNTKSEILFVNSGISKKMFSQVDRGITGGDVRIAEIMRGAIEKNLKVHLLATSRGELFCKKFNLQGVICHNFDFKSVLPGRAGFVLLLLKHYFLPFPKP